MSNSKHGRWSNFISRLTWRWLILMSLVIMLLVWYWFEKRIAAIDAMIRMIEKQ